MPYAERNLPLSAALVACLGVFGLERPVLAEEILIPGVDTGSDILRALALAHDGRMRGELVLVPPPVGAGSALADVIGDRATLARIDRPLRMDEREAGLVARPLFTLPVLVLVHPGLGKPNLRASDLAAILDGRILDWSSLGGPRLPIRLVTRDGPPEHVPHPRWARAERHADLVAIVRRSPGSLGLSTARLLPEDEPLLATIDGFDIRDPRYPHRIEVALAHRPGRLTPAVRSFLAFLASARAAELVSAYGGTPSRP
ncbi:MAG: substrate-binding domain-containing protein [Beijerinckiaceae bacterium]|nr:substrate-binding domain-containing protein [Beijerinckiaceae bacterium]